MNPVLLKPETTTGAQVIVQGQRQESMTARQYFRTRLKYMGAVLDSFHKVAAKADIVLVEGAGSPGEINLRDGDLANMGFAEAADLPAILIGDIHRGGVIASIAGTFDILPQADRNRLKAFLINKFHGDPELFSEGQTFLESRTGAPCVGIVPHFEAARSLPAEDAVALEDVLTTSRNGLRISVLRLPRIANFDDLDPLRLEPGVTLTFVQPGEPIPADTRLVIIPGSKSTVSDLAAVRKEGWDIDLLAHVRRGGLVLGLCGGYQMLGRLVSDPQGLEGAPGSVPGLGLLDVETTLLPDKTLTRISGTHVPSGTALDGYEIHLGKTTGVDCARPFALLEGRPDGAINASGQVMGSYLHGCFSSDVFRAKFLTSLGIQASDLRFEATIERVLDDLAAHLEANLDLDLILSLAKEL
jgi:adenosylcobyric acid synthase